MTKEVLYVFQDCALGACANPAAQMADAENKGITLRLTPFNAPGARSLILQAKSRGVGRLPFYTDGKKFSYDLNDFVPQAEGTEKPSRAAKTHAKETAKEAGDGNSAKAE